MNANLYSIYPLRGMDHRWRPPDVGARRIRDMRYDRRDGWKDAGGFSHLTPFVSVPLGLEETLPHGTSTINSFRYFGEIESLHWFSQHSGRRQWLIWEAEWQSEGMTFWYFNGSTAGTFGGGFTEIRDAAGNRLPWYTNSTKTYQGRRVHSGPRPRTQSLAWNGTLYLVNGSDPPMVFDGYKAERAGFDMSPTPPSGQSTDHGRSNLHSVGLGANAINLPKDGEGDSAPLRKAGYRYRVSFVNERGQESPLSAPSGVIQITNPDVDEDDEMTGYTDSWNNQKRRGKKFIHITIPQGGETVVGRRIYRTKNVLNAYGAAMSTQAAENFFFLTEIRDNLSTSWEDGIPDGFLGATVDDLDFGPWPQRANLIAAFKNTVFLGGSSVTDIRYSAPLMPEVFPVDNVISLGQDSAGEITGMYTTKSALVVFKRSAIYLIKGDPSRGFHAEPLTRDTGCLGPDAMSEIPGRGLAFLGDNGVYLLRGALENTGTPTGVEHLSTPIDDEMERLNKSAAVQAVALTYKRDREWWLSVPMDGSDQNNFVFVYHYDVGSWSYRENYPIGCAITTSDHRGHLFFGSNYAGTDVRGGVHVYHHGAANKANASYPIEPLYETTDLNFGSVFKAVSPKYFMVNCIGYGNNDIQVNYNINRNIAAARTTTKDADQQNPEDRFDVYGTVTWGGGTWAEHRPIVLRFDVTTIDKPAVRELRVSVECAGRRIQVMGLDLGVVASAPIGRLPINEALLGTRG